MAALAEPITSTLAVYMRVSTEEQKQQQTVETQRAAADRYLAIQDVVPYGWYADDGVSGTLPLSRRPEGARLLADVRAGHIKTVLIHKLDRLGRSVRVLIDARDELRAYGAELVSINEHLDSSNAAGRMFFNQLSAFAEFDRDTILERTAAGTARRLTQGGWLGGQVPYGYRVVGVKKDARLVPDESEGDGAMSPAEVVRLIFRLMGEQGWTLQRIADHLTGLGIPPTYTKSQKPYKHLNRDHPTLGIWRASGVHRILTNPVYHGVWIYGKHSAKPQAVPLAEDEVLLSSEVWEAAQAALARHRHVSPPNTQHDYLLRGLMVCGVCGHLYAGTAYPLHKNGRMDRYYVCNGKRHAASLYGRAQAEARRCASKSIRATWIEQQVWADVEQYVRKPDKTLTLLAARMSGESDQYDAIRAEMAAVAGKLEAQQAEKDKVIGLFRKSLITERDVERQYTDIEHEAARLRRQYEQLATRASQSADVAERLATAQATLERLHARLDAEGDHPEIRRQFMEDLIVSIRVNMDSAGTSRRGRPKLRPVVSVTYCFDPPAPPTTLDSSSLADCSARRPEGARHRG